MSVWDHPMVDIMRRLAELAERSANVSVTVGHTTGKTVLGGRLSPLPMGIGYTVETELGDGAVTFRYEGVREIIEGDRPSIILTSR